MIQPDTPIAVTLPAERWEQVLRFMGEAPLPHRITDPLMREIQRQCMAADEPPAQPPILRQVPASSGAAE